MNGEKWKNRIQESEFRIQNEKRKAEYRSQNSGFRIKAKDFSSGSWILDSGFLFFSWILDSGFWILLLFAIFNSEVRAIDTLRVASPDPVLESWRWTAFDRSSGLAGGVRDIFEDRDGNVWFATDQGAQRYDGMRWTTYTTKDGLAHNSVRTIIQTRDGAIWFGTYGGGISRFDPSALRQAQDSGQGGKVWTTYTTADGLASNYIWFRGLHQARDGSVWAGFGVWGDTTGTRGGISRFDGKTWTTIEVPGGPPRPNIGDIHEASDGSIWFTTLAFGAQGYGVFRFDGRRWTRYTTADGLAGNNGTDILESRDGSIWVANGLFGISRFDGKRWRAYTARDGLPEGVSFISFWQTADGTTWAGSSNGTLCRFDPSTRSTSSGQAGSGQGGERWKAYTREEVPQFSGALFGRTTRDGEVWFYEWGAERAFRLDYATTKWKPFVLADTLSGGFPTPDGSVWFSTRSGAVRYDGKRWLRYTSKDGLIDAPIFGRAQTDDGSLYFFAGEPEKFQGLSRYKDGTWRRYLKEEVGLDAIATQHDLGRLHAGLEELCALKFRCGNDARRGAQHPAPQQPVEDALLPDAADLGGMHAHRLEHVGDAPPGAEEGQTRAQQVVEAEDVHDLERPQPAHAEGHDARVHGQVPVPRH